MRSIVLAVSVVVFVTVAAADAQQPSGTWAVAKPVVDKWDAAYKAAGRTVAVRDNILAEIRGLLDQHPSDVWVYEAAALGYNHLNHNPEALDVLRAYLRRFPNDSSLDQRVLFFWGNWGAVQDLESLPARWHGQREYWQCLLRAYAREKASPEKLERAGNEILQRIPKQDDPGGNERFEVAEYWLANAVNPRAAERVAREAVAISEVGSRPSMRFANQQQRRIQNRLLIRNVNRSALGWSLYHQERYGDALVELERAAKISEQDSIPARAVYYRLGQTLEKLARPRDAIEAYYRELAWGNLEKPTKAALAVVYRSVHGSLDGLDVAERTRVNELAMQRAEKDSDLTSAVDEELGRFDLLDPNGHPLDLTSYRGKVLIIDFWATWCGVCMATMKHTDLLQKKFGDSVAVIAPSGDPEDTRLRAAEFLRKMNYRFALVFDDERRRDIKLPFIPARLLLDRRGRLRFMEFGYTPASAMLLEQKLESLIAPITP